MRLRLLFALTSATLICAHAGAQLLNFPSRPAERRIVYGPQPKAVPAPVFIPSSSRFYVIIRGGRGGFRGEAVPITAFDYHLMRPRDPQTGGMLIGRQHSPVTVTEVANSISPMLFQALATNDIISSVEICNFVPGVNGQLVPEETITLTNACVVDFHQYMGNDGFTTTPHALEDITFSYQSVSIKHNPSGMASSDFWSNFGYGR